jgi:hypothetical protein
MFRNLRQSQNIRMRLGGRPDPCEPFPERPRGMHRRTYLRLGRAPRPQRQLYFDAARASGPIFPANALPLILRDKHAIFEQSLSNQS